MTIAEFTTKLIGDKRRWRAYQARVRQLPASHRRTIKALERYLLRFGPADADTAASMFEDLATRFELAAAAGTPVRDIVGDDPVAYVRTFLEGYSTGGLSTEQRQQLVDQLADESPVLLEAFLQEYATGGWAAKERKKLAGAVARATSEGTAPGQGTLR